MTAVYAVSDIHGHPEKLLGSLRAAELTDAEGNWSGKDARLWFLGDFFDRGPDGIGVVDLVMRLQPEAEQVGGQVRALLGNHEILFLGAQRFQGMKKFTLSWQRNGG